MKNILKSEGGFTLVELLGVVAIIAVLATVAITSINGAIQAGRDSAISRQIQTLNSAYQNYLAAGGANDLDEAGILSALRTTVNVGAGPIGPFLTTTPQLTYTRGNGDPATIGFNASNGWAVE